jgi:hypothetical protein
LGWIYLEDAELTLSWGGTRGGAQRTFGVAWAGLAGRDQLAGKLDEICGQRYRRAGGLFKEGRFAEGDLFIEQAGFGFIAVLLLPGRVAAAGGGLRGEVTMRCAQQGRCGGISEEADCKAGKCGGEGLRAGVCVVCAGAAGGWPGRFGRAEFGLRPESEFARELGRRFDLGRMERVVVGGFMTDGFLIEGILFEGIKEPLLGLGDGLGVERGDLGCGLGLLGGALGLRGKVRAIAEGVSVSLGYGGGDAGGARGDGGCGRECAGECRLGRGSTAAMCGEAFSDLATEGPGGGGRHSAAGRGVGLSGRGWKIAGHFGKGRVERGGVKQSGAHFAQNSNSLP